MTPYGSTIDPFAIVADALRCPRGSLSIDSAMYRTHGWDSFGHISVIAALQQFYGISISDDEMMDLTNMRAISAFHERSFKLHNNDHSPS